MTTNEITVQGEGLRFTQEQRQILLDTFANGASDQEFVALVEVAQKRNLDPFKREIFFVKRWDAGKGREVWATQVAIDGLRLVAERSGLYAGQDEPEFEERDGALYLARVRVWRKDWPRPAVGVARWSEYVQTTRDKQSGQTRPNAMWSKMPYTMLAKCAEALAIRKAFPESAAGLYTDDEMGQALNEAPAPPPPQRADVRPVERKPAQLPDPRALAPMGIEAPRTERGRDHVREATASVGGDNPTLGEHNVAVAEAVADEKPAPKEEHPVLTAFCARVTEIELPGECVTVWMKHRAALADLPAPDREDAWKTLCQCCETVGHMKAGTAKKWLKGAIGAEDEKRAAQPAAEVQS